MPRKTTKIARSLGTPPSEVDRLLSSEGVARRLAEMSIELRSAENSLVVRAAIAERQTLSALSEVLLRREYLDAAKQLQASTMAIEREMFPGVQRVQRADRAPAFIVPGDDEEQN